jgi:hypothetical protein
MWMQLTARAFRVLVAPLVVLTLVALVAPIARAEGTGASPKRQGTKSTVADPDDPPSSKEPPKESDEKPVEQREVRRASIETAAYGDSDHVSVFTPSISAGIASPAAGVTFNMHYLVDVVSAASVDIVSTASRRWSEVRQAGAADVTFKPSDFGVALAASFSTEPDYLSLGGGGNILYDFDQKNFTLLVGYGYGHDTIGRGGTSFTDFSRTLAKHNLRAGLSMVLSRSTVLGLSMEAMIESGDSSKPYRYVPMFSSAIAPKVPVGASIEDVTSHRLPERPLEQLPLLRRRFALTERFAHRFDTSTLRIEERIYDDTWALRASTTDVRWIFDLGRRWAIWPHGRYHVQSPVNFWQRAYVSGGGGVGAWNLPEFRTGDRELGPLSTITGGGGIRYFFGSDADPKTWSIGAQSDVMYTSYTDDLYITSRTAILGVLTLDGEM